MGLVSLIYSTLCLFLLWTPDNRWTTFLILCSVRLVTVSLALRTYVGPWILTQLSSHIKVRSVSLRSIRGIYFRSGALTWHVDRIGASYRRPCAEGSSRLSIKIEGLSLEIGKERVSKPKPRPRRGTITLTDLSPSPIAYWLWSIVAGIYAFVEPYSRPLVRTTFVAGLRLFIRCLPALTQHLDFELNSAIVTLASLPGTRLMVREALLHTEISLAGLESVIPSEEEDFKTVPHGRTKSLSLAAWKIRLSKSFGRTWDRAWGKTQVVTSFSFQVHDIKGLTIPSTASGPLNGSFFDLPGSISLSSSISFNPRRGILEPRSLKARLDVDAFYVAVDVVRSLFISLRKDYPLPEEPPINDNLDSSGIMSPLSPISPFMEALTSIGSRARRRFPRPIVASKPLPWLSSLMTLDVNISSVRLLHAFPSPEKQNYEGLIRGIECGIKLSDPDQKLHHEHFGRNETIDADVDADVYTLHFSVKSTVLDRFDNATHESYLRLLSLGTIDLQVLISQWPSPWLVAAPLLPGDPNAPQVVLNVVIASLEITERMEYLHQLLSQSKSTPSIEDSPVFPPIVQSVPRVSIDVTCGPIRANIICPNALADGQPLSIETRTDGFLLTARSRFHLGSKSHKADLFSDRISLRMNFETTFVLNPSFVRVRHNSRIQRMRHRFSRADMSDTDVWGDAILSLEMVEVHGDGAIMGDMNDDTDHAASLDIPSAVVRIHSSTEALCFELWHPSVIIAVSKILSLIQSQTSSVGVAQTPKRLLKQLPFGLSSTISIARLTFLVTGKDLNSDDDLELSRGLGFRTGVRIQYHALHPEHNHHFKDVSAQSQTRHKLYLAEDNLMEALESAKASSVTRKAHASFRLVLWDTAFRSAVATPYVADDPYIAERDDPMLRAREYLRVRNVKVDVRLSGRRDTVDQSLDDLCEIVISVPYVEGTFQIAHVFSALLAVHAVASLKSRPYPRAPKRSSKISYKLKAAVTTVQILWNLPNQRLATRVDSLSTESSSAGSHELEWKSALFWVPGLPKIGERGETSWEEFIRLQRWRISIPGVVQPLNISIEGDNARLRIPFGFVLADLVLDLTLTMKTLRHVMRMVDAGKYLRIPTPGPEGPKLVPNLKFAIRCLSLEAADDNLESRLGLIWRAGFSAAKDRAEREEAFRIKVATILAANSSQSPVSLAQELDSDYQFSSQHTVSVEDARDRLFKVHTVDWFHRYSFSKEERNDREDVILRRTLGASTQGQLDIPNIVPVVPIDRSPPLFRAALHDLSLKVSQPSFPLSSLPEFLFKQGKGVPQDTQFSLLVPMHLNFTLSSLRITLRDYPLPLLDVPPAVGYKPVWEFDTDLVVAEEIGTSDSVDWLPCNIVEPHEDIPGSIGTSILVPKTIMPVKTYASPIIRVTTEDITAFSWNVSYGPAIQDFMRVIETLSHSPRDSSPGVGFWDKIRLMLHWSIRIAFKEEVRLYMKGSRDPYKLTDDGAGFALCWQGHTKLTIGHHNEDKELIQVISDTMLIIIPNFEGLYQPDPHAVRPPRRNKSQSVRKICAKLSSGTRFGVGFVLERSCGDECTSCTGSAFHRGCRFFQFLPHYEVKLEKKAEPPALKSPNDSYNGFRSDFIHLSISLTSSVRSMILSETNPSPSNIHLTPQTFAHFWSWWSLFDGVLTLPIRQGSYYPPRHISPKFGRHLATIKYRISVPQLFISHVYVDDSRESWIDGITPFVGVKAMLDHFQADLHQRDQETVMPGATSDDTKVTRHKPFYAVEVDLKGLDLRALLAIFSEPLKHSVPVTSPPEISNYRTRSEMPATDPSSLWIDLDDFLENVQSKSEPTIHLLPIVTCSHFTYFKHNPQSTSNSVQSSKFGGEDTHTCLLGKQSSVAQIQIRLAMDRINELRKLSAHGSHKDQVRSWTTGAFSNDRQETKKDHHNSEKMIALLEDYVAYLRDVDVASDKSGTSNEQSYYMPSDSVSPDEWAQFENVCQVHCPKIFITNAIRDVMMQYYHCSRSRRGFEYHMATRAVKFIRDQANVIPAVEPRDSMEKPSGTQAAAVALRKFLGGESSSKPSVEVSREPARPSGVIDPLNGWSDGVSLRKSFFCLLLKPQVVLRCEASTDSVCVLAAVQAKLQTFSILDNLNADDPVSGNVMSRNYSSLTGLQTFSPTKASSVGDGYVPLEVLIDYRCESSEFDRVVPQTDATFHYDKFNRLRLRNNVTSVGPASTEQSTIGHSNHLQNQTDLIQIHIPQFTVTATEEHFQAISNIVTKLVLFSDPAHKMRLEKLETLLFTYDFTDLTSAANVVENLQGRLRGAIETQRMAEPKLYNAGSDEKLELLKLEAHIFLLSEELNYIFDAIKLAQDRIDDHTDQKSALLLHASSSEISWRMLDNQKDLLAKLAVRDIDYRWLSRQDSSTVNHLDVGDLQAFDGSPHAIWAEIVAKHNEPANHPLCKRGLFLIADWTVLAPVGGITIYEDFQVDLHPIRLQLDAKVGIRIMEYVWPARRQRKASIEGHPDSPGSKNAESEAPTPPIVSRSSLDSARLMQTSQPRKSLESNNKLGPPLRKLGVSRSFTDLRSSAAESPAPTPPFLNSRTHSIAPEHMDYQIVKRRRELDRNKPGDAAEMKTRSSQKTFVYVKISSLHLLLSILKEESFECRDAHIQTRDLEYRNQTWSFEELVDQFLPSDMSWKGWVKMAFNQPLVPVLPVARELISKTKWINTKGSSSHSSHVDLSSPKAQRSRPLGKDTLMPSHPHKTRSRTVSPHKRWKKTSHREIEVPPSSFTATPLTTEPESLEDDPDTDGEPRQQSRSRSRMLSLFGRSRKSIDSHTSSYRNSTEGESRQSTIRNAQV